MLESTLNLAGAAVGVKDLCSLMAARCPSAIYVYDFSTDQNIWVNRQLALLLGYPEEWAAERHDRFLNPLLHPDDVARLTNAPTEFDPLMNGQVIERVLRLRHASGEWRWYHIHEVMLTELGEGLPSLIMGTLQDVTALKTAELQLAQREAVLSSLLENTPDFVVRYDRDLRILYMNSAVGRGTGVDTSEFVGQTLPEAVGAIDPNTDNMVIHLRQVLETNQPTELDLLFEDPFRMIHVRLVPEFGSQGEVCTVLGVGRDLTDRAVKEQQAFEAAQTRQLRQFITDTGREVRNPLSVLVTSSYLLRRHSQMMITEAQKLLDGSTEITLDMLRALQQVEELAQRINERADVMLAGVEELHTFFDSMTQMVKLDEMTQYHFAVHDLNRLVRMVVANLVPLASAKDLAIEYKVLDSPLPMQLDWDWLVQAFHNLGKNALEFTKRGGIYVQIRRAEREVWVEFHDTGIGIEANRLPHVWNQIGLGIYKPNEDRLTTGFGLAIARKIVEMHHGRIEVESVPLQGSTFRVILPLDFDGEQAKRRTQSTAPTVLTS